MSVVQAPCPWPMKLLHESLLMALKTQLELVHLQHLHGGYCISSAKSRYQQVTGLKMCCQWAFDVAIRIKEVIRCLSPDEIFKQSNLACDGMGPSNLLGYISVLEKQICPH